MQRYVADNILTLSSATPVLGHHGEIMDLVQHHVGNVDHLAIHNENITKVDLVIILLSSATPSFCSRSWSFNFHLLLRYVLHVLFCDLRSIVLTYTVIRHQVFISSGRRCRNHMVVGFTTTCVISAM
jgi:hypothetical protein